MPTNEFKMKIAFYLVAGRKKNLYCRINDGKERITFSLEYAVDPQKWDSKKEMLDDEDVQYFTLHQLKNRLNKKYHLLKTEGKEDILNLLKTEADNLMNGNGLEGIAKSLFDLENKDKGVPPYDEFVKAFEKFSSLNKAQYKVQPLDESIHFHTDEDVFEMDTYSGLHARLKGYVENESYDEIYTQTESWIWKEIYIDAGIEQHKFIPVLLSNWEHYWFEEYKEIKESVGSTDHLDETKARSWREVQVFMGCYKDAGNVIELAEEIDEMNLYALAVITMLEIFDADTCYEEYCEHEFERSDVWESISLNDDDENFDGPIFFIKSYEI